MTASPQATATTTTTKPTTTTTTHDDACIPCVKLLQAVLSNSASIPRQLLQSMAQQQQRSSPQHEEVFQVQSIPNGVQVQIPASLQQQTRRWTRLFAVPEQQQETIIEADPVDVDSISDVRKEDLTSVNNNTSKPNTANSSVEDLTAETAAPATSTAASFLRRQQLATSSLPTTKTEWLTLQCRPCADTGAEANARAFVMGPSPLSVVVCTNRLLHQANDLIISNNDDNDNYYHSPPTVAAIAEMEEILTHELIHVYDVRQLQLDLRDCENLAYSEVRAAREAECRRHGTTTSSASSTLSRQQQQQQQQQHSWWHTTTTSAAATAASTPTNNATPDTKQQASLKLDNCVHQKAFTATQNLFGAQHAQRCLDRVFHSAMRDHRPFAVAAADKDRSHSASATNEHDDASQR